MQRRIVLVRTSVQYTNWDGCLFSQVRVTRVTSLREWPSCSAHIGLPRNQCSNPYSVRSTRSSVRTESVLGSMCVERCHPCVSNLQRSVPRELWALRGVSCSHMHVATKIRRERSLGHSTAVGLSGHLPARCSGC